MSLGTESRGSSFFLLYFPPVLEELEHAQSLCPFRLLLGQQDREAAPFPYLVL